MKELALFQVVVILALIAFVMIWNRHWQGKIVDEREANLRLQVRMMISRAVEIALVFSYFTTPRYM